MELQIRPLQPQIKPQITHLRPEIRPPQPQIKPQITPLRLKTRPLSPLSQLLIP